MIAIIDYNAGNPNSVQNMLKRLGVNDSLITSDSLKINESDKIILPGVGSFDYCISQLENLELIEILNHNVIKIKKPILGICMGMQMMAKCSQEGKKNGLGWIEGEVLELTSITNLPVPHMGWNKLKKGQNSFVFQDLEYDNSKFYFAHSYYFNVSNSSHVVAYTQYGDNFPSIINKNNIYGVQFHPEKSHRWGLQLLQKFINIKK